MSMELKEIAVFRSPLKEKFGIPRQSGLVDETEGEIVFLPQYRNKDAVRGMEQYRYLWILWGFSANSHAATSPVVRPPMLGGNERKGVFATRSPYRPNAIGLSSVRIISVEGGDAGHGCGDLVIRVAGADLMDGTPIYDIKPYLEYTDCHVGAGNGFTKTDDRPLEIRNGEMLAPTGAHSATVSRLLSLDPRPRYHDDPERVYGMRYDRWNIRFRVDGDVLTIVGCEKTHQ